MGASEPCGDAHGRGAPRIEEQLGSARAEIARVERRLERYFEAFATGDLSAAHYQERVRSHHGPLEALRERKPTSPAGSRHGHTRRRTRTTLAGLADRLDEILANESPEQAKELLRLLIKEIRVHNRRRIVPR